MDVRQLPRAVGGWSWATEARSIEILMRLQVSAWIAYDRWHDTWTWRTEVVSAVYAVSTPCSVIIRASRNVIRVKPCRPGSAQPQVNVAQRTEIWTTLPSGYT